MTTFTAQQILEIIENKLIETIRNGFYDEFLLVDVLIELGYTDEQLERLSERGDSKWVFLLSS